MRCTVDFPRIWCTLTKNSEKRSKSYQKRTFRMERVSLLFCELLATQKNGEKNWNISYIDNRNIGNDLNFFFNSRSVLNKNTRIYFKFVFYFILLCLTFSFISAYTIIRKVKENKKKKHFFYSFEFPQLNCLSFFSIGYNKWIGRFWKM